MSDGEDGRAESFRAHGIFFCPSWCQQPPDEHDYELHVTEATPVECEGMTVAVRGYRSWDSGDCHVGLAVYQSVNYGTGTTALSPVDLGAAAGSIGELFLSADEWAAMRDAVDDQLSAASDDDEEQPAYDEAQEEYEAYVDSVQEGEGE
jgi:hypothetical protein